MSKPVPIRIRTGAKPNRHNRGNAWRITGDMRDRTETLSWGRWHDFSAVSNVIRKAVKSGRALVMTSGKKDKKFWRKVQRRIERLAP